MLLLIGIFEFLDGHEGTAFDVAAFQHHPVGALADC